jgi:hypothetical protein
MDALRNLGATQLSRYAVRRTTGTAQGTGGSLPGDNEARA